MSVIVVGDRAVGKTTMVYYLADSSDQERVMVKDGPNPIIKDMVPPTESMESDKPIKMFVDLPIRREIKFLWTDTPGETFTSKDYRLNNRSAWESIKTKMSQSRYLILLVPPHQEIIKSSLLKFDPQRRGLNDFPLTEDWQIRMEQWLDLFSRECPEIKHLLICLHQADLICDNIRAEADKWRYQINGYSWNDYSHMVYDTYFSELNGDVIAQYQDKHQKQLISFFLTTIKQRALLELPWLYIGTHEKTIN